MKKIIQLLVLIATLVIAGNALAQERVYSLSMKEKEIEESIKKSLDPFLNRKDYVVKVRLRGTDKLEPAKRANIGQVQTAGDELPGFEMEDLSSMPKITDVIGNTFWQIKSVQVDLILHKEVSPSVDAFIRQTIPVVSEMDSQRGDKFNFVPIIPRAIGDDPQEEAPKSWLVAERNRTLGMTPKTWIYVLIILVLAVVGLWMYMRMQKMKKNLNAMEEAVEIESEMQESKKHQDLLDEMKKEKDERLQRHETQVRESMLRDENERLTQKIITLLVGRKEWGKDLPADLGHNVDKLAHFVAIVGSSTARKLLSEGLGSKNYLDIEKQAENIQTEPAKDREILNQIHKILFAKELQSPEMLSSNPFTFLKEMTAGQVGMLIKDEPVKIKTVVLSRVDSQVAANVIAKLPKEERSQVIVQLGKITDIPMELMEKVAYDLADKAKYIPDDNSVGFDGVDMVVELMGESSASVRKDIINNLRTADRKLSDQIESRFFLFDSIPVVPNDILTQVVRSFQADDVVTAISGASKSLQEKVIMCFPEKIRRTLVSNLKGSSPSAEDIKEKRRLLVTAMQKLAEDGKVDLRKIQTDWAKQSASAKKAS